MDERDISGQQPHSSDDAPPAPPRRHRARLLGMGAIAGLSAAAAGLGVAELVAAASTAWQSPVLDVGDRVVDGVPIWLKDLAIRWFGQSDKVALLAGIGVLLAVYALTLGVVTVTARRGTVLGPAGVAVFALVGTWSALTSRREAPWTAALPTVVGAVVAALALIGLGRLATGRARPQQDRPDRAPSIVDMTPNDRRRFLAAAGLGVLAAGAAGGLGRRWGQGSAGSARRALTLPPARVPLAAAPATVSAGVDGVAPFFTPSNAFYRIDTALTIPQVSLEDWALVIDGLVERPLRLTFDQLLSRDLDEADITLTCVSNEVGGSLVGTARWLGVRLDALLDEAGVLAHADQVVGRSVDGYTCGFPVAALDGRDALVAVGMNGEPLPFRHGFPARLVVPGLYGYVSATKWLREVELTRFDAFDQYWVRRGWDREAPVKTQTRIDAPRGLANLEPGEVMVGGVAWAQTRGIERVEVRVDDGDWVDASLAEAWNDVTWRQWSFRWMATPGRHTITARATDGTGAIQTAERSEPFPNGATGHHQIVVIVR